MRLNRLVVSNTIRDKQCDRLHLARTLSARQFGTPVLARCTPGTGQRRKRNGRCQGANLISPLLGQPQPGAGTAEGSETSNIKAAQQWPPLVVAVSLFLSLLIVVPWLGTTEYLVDAPHISHSVFCSAATHDTQPSAANASVVGVWRKHWHVCTWKLRVHDLEGFDRTCTW